MIDVKRIEPGRFSVTVTEGGSASQHTVSLDDSYYMKLTGGSITEEELINRSFEFLLKRESKESILSQFNLKVISNYFPEYENQISL
jgi:hypothetical protein